MLLKNWGDSHHCPRAVEHTSMISIFRRLGTVVTVTPVLVTSVLGLLAQALLQILLILFLQRRIMRTRVNIARLVLPRIQFHLGPLIVNMRDVSLIENLLHELRRNEIKTAAIAEYDIARHDRSVADLYRHIDACNHGRGVINRRGMYRAIVDRHADWEDAFHIPDGSVHHQSSLGRVPDGCRKVVSHHRASFDFSVKSDHRHIARL